MSRPKPAQARIARIVRHPQTAFERLQQQYLQLKENIKEMQEIETKMKKELQESNHFDYDLIAGTKTPIK